MRSAVQKGFILLTISGVVCKILGAFFRLPLTYILTVEGIGVFQLVMSLFSFALVLSSGGVTITLSKLISSFRAKKEDGKIKWCVYLAFCYCVVISFVFGLLFFFLSKEISILQSSLHTSFSYKLFIPLLLFSSLVALFRGVFQGYENMLPTALSQIIEQLGKFVFGLIFAFLLSKKSIELGVAGAFIGIILSEVLAFIYLVLSKQRIKFKKCKIVKFEKKHFYSYLLPATWGLAISSFVHFFDALVIVGRLVSSGVDRTRATSLFGLQTGVVGAILNFPIIISFALSTSLLPKLSFETSSSKKKLNNNTKKGFYILWLSVLPITLGLVAISSPLFRLVYPFFDHNTTNYAIRLMAMGGLSTILLAVMQYFTTILQSKGDFGFVCIALSVGALIKILVSFFLTPIINIFAMPLGNILFSLVAIVLCLIKLKGRMKIETNFFFIPLISSLVMLIAVSLFNSVVSLSPFFNIIISLCLGALIYIGLCFPLFKGFILEMIGKNKSRRKSEFKRSNGGGVKEN